MSDVLHKIIQAIKDHRYILSGKSIAEMDADGINIINITESVCSATEISKKIRSRSPLRAHAREMLYVIKSQDRNGLMIYTKGKFEVADDKEIYYKFISAKRMEP